jgi:hypothetical protein
MNTERITLPLFQWQPTEVRSEHEMWSALRSASRYIQAREETRLRVRLADSEYFQQFEEEHSSEAHQI